MVKHSSFIDDLEKKDKTFKTCLTRLQEEAIPKSNSHLYYNVQSRQ